MNNDFKGLYKQKDYIKKITLYKRESGIARNAKKR